MNSFPIEEAIPHLRETLRSFPNVILSAPPGAGKTTRVPIALLDEEWMQGKRLIMLEPRRLAARRAAQFMASQLGESVGQTTGYRIRGESKVSRLTRIEVVTEGVLTRMLHGSPDLPGVALVVFDEFHERSIHADLGLALTLDVQEHLRPDLKILVMSATLDGLAVSKLLGDAPIVQSEGRSFPVETKYLQFPVERGIEPKVADVICRALNEESGDLLVFLPGQREIRRVERLLEDMSLPDAVVHLLFGEANEATQQAAFTSAPNGKRKIILSTSIAETSLTIDGVRIVVDAGLVRGPRFDPHRGMSGLVTTPVSKATADQRRGRAGRQQSGICYRLWTKEHHEQLPAYPFPEILVADLSPLALDLARWGNDAHLRFLDRPPSAHVSQARTLLTELGALDARGILTQHGKAMSEIPVHPRLAHMLLRGTSMKIGGLACDLAALLQERDLLRGNRQSDIDLASRMHALRSSGIGDDGARRRVVAEAKRLREILSGKESSTSPDGLLGVLLAYAYPERIARRRGMDQRRYQLANGTGALLPEGSRLNQHEYLAVADVDGVGTEVKVFLAASIDVADLFEWFQGSIVVKAETFWSAEEEAVVARKVKMLGALILAEQQSDDVEKVQEAMIAGIVEMGLQSLPWTKEALGFKDRSEWVRTSGFATAEWPDLSDEHLKANSGEWLSPFLNGISRRSHLSRLDMRAILQALFSHKQLKDLDRLAPPALEVPTGSQIRLDYSSGHQPVLAVKLQEMFGQTDTPLIAGGRGKVLIHLLSPAGRPLAVTQDLRSFWINIYPEVRKEMRGRYPKHPWPEDPLTAIPTKRTKKRSAGRGW